MEGEGASWIKLAVPIAVMILWGIVSAIGKKNKAQRLQRPQPPVREAKLPGEGMVDSVFGPYIQRRREEYEARRQVVVIDEDEEDDVEYEEERTPVPEIRIVEERPVRPSELPPSAVAAAPSEKRRWSLEELIFANRNLSTGAKLVLANEILQRPRSLRR